MSTMMGERSASTRDGPGAAHPLRGPGMGHAEHDYGATASTYNPTTSRDGMSEDPAPFSRLDAPKRYIPWKEEAAGRWRVQCWAGT